MDHTTKFNDPVGIPTLHDNISQMIADLVIAKTHVTDLEGQLRAAYDALREALPRTRKPKAAQPAKRGRPVGSRTKKAETLMYPEREEARADGDA